jgi:hypothetical protein
VVKLDGKRLRGTYALIKFKERSVRKNWLVMRTR